MHQSLTIARLVGPVLSAIGIGMLANQVTYREMAAQFLGGLPFSFFGVLMLVAGLAILNAHPAWTRDWRSTVTAIGSGSSLVSARSASSRLSLPTSSPARLLPTPAFSSALASSCSRSAALSPSRVMQRECSHSNWGT
ncbi:MAG TPA: hypothetical protein VFJ59_00380 [Pseudolabrys sp.]|nr:hypothetical protein [Pseudolabrys sp.]